MSKTITTTTRVMETDVVDKPAPPASTPKPKKFSFDSEEEMQKWIDTQIELRTMQKNYPRLAAEEKARKDKEKEKEKQKKEKEKVVEKAKTNSIILFLAIAVLILFTTLFLVASINNNFSNQDNLVPIGITYYNDTD